MTGSIRKRGTTWTAYWWTTRADGRRRQVSKGGLSTKKGLVTRNVADGTTPPRLPRPAEQSLAIWTPRQLGAFLTAVEEDPLYALWRLFAVTGCRRGEGVAVRWSATPPWPSPRMSTPW